MATFREVYLKTLMKLIIMQIVMISERIQFLLENHQPKIQPKPIIKLTTSTILTGIGPTK